jgi:signal transduction histidine kinase
LADFRKQTGLAVGLQDDAGQLALQAERLTAAFRIFQEALTNVARHAQASAVEVTLNVHAGELHLEVHDNGRGIPPEALSGKGALGLVGMRERAQSVGGQLDIRSAPGEGTIVHLRLPLEG